MGVITRSLSHRACAMLFVLIVLVAAGVEVSATSPRRYQTSECQSPAERDAVGRLLCGPNSHFERCSKVCPPQTCSALIDPYWMCESQCCRAECRCNDGYYKDDRTGRCISRDECLAQCGPLERFVKDSTECQQTCANCKVTGPRSLCKPFTGCVCAEGRVRLNDNATGPCVLKKQCPRRQCPLHEHYEKCPSICVKETCVSMNPDYKCLKPAIPLPCKPRCICDKGYLRNHLGQCIPKHRCPIKRCPINEVLRCSSTCPKDSCKQLEPGFKCPREITSVCIPACTCKDGYMRDDRGHCIPKELCPASLRCGINEVAVKCKAYPPLTCESVYTLYKQIDNPLCVPGCDCRPGYLRNKRNICVPSELCPTVPQNQCGPRQVYKECGSTCEPSCSDLDNPPQSCPKICVKGCFCKDGYLKDERGNCVERQECPLPICNKPNEVATDCGSYCDIRTCEDYNKTNVICPAVCVRGCFCRKGYVRNAYGVCIRPEKCPPQPVCLQENEEYQSCGSSCPDNCANYMNPDRICTLNCVAGCNCKQGYVRNLDDNTCIKPEQCPTKKCPGPNEELNYCASYCPVTCANRLTLGDWSCITLCREACECVSGTLRSDNGTCVPVDQCSPPVCRQNEKYLKCGTACPLTCDNYKKPVPCTLQCVEGCFCEDGFVRDRFNQCVKPENCEPICPVGEKFSECSAHCQDTCENYNVTNRICTRQCQSGCVCEPGTVRRKDNKCVSPSECSQITCPADEEYDSCSAHCEDTCETHGQERPCTAICIPGCRCSKGLVRRSDGKCVKFEQCPPPCPPSEHYDECNAHCEDTCERHGINVTCPPNCSGGCRCNDGLVRRKDGQCVNLADCSASPCSDTEEYDPCSSHCEPTCESNGLSLLCAAYCEPGCRCKGTLVRRKDRKCVKLEECGSKPQCGINERWVDCVLGLCIPLTCDQLGYPIACPGIIGQCEGGCVCAENYVRDSNNKCIRQQDCPSCRNDFNATVGCGNNCGRLCTDYQNPPNCGPLSICQLYGCDCRDGYVYDTVTERCVAPVDCPIPCNGDLYAEKVKCPNPCPPTCAQPTTAVCARACLTEGCQCRLNFVRDAKGKCVKPEDCPTNIGCNGDPNAHISSCVSLCQPTCSGEPRFCPAFCRLGCACNTGYVLTKPGGVCVKPEQCVNVTITTTEEPIITTEVVQPLILCPRNEIWIECKAAYCKPQYCRDVDAKLVCPLIAKPCDGGCICKDGLLRNEEGVCIPKDQCPTTKPCSDPNAIRKKCASHESCRATCAVPNSRVCPKICIIDGCECKQGYVLSEKGGKCVQIDDCPRVNVSCNGDPNAVIQSLPPACPSTCKLPNGIPTCLKLGLDVGCVCKPGYLLSAEGGKCILPDQCEGGNPCGANATFSWCRVNCPYDYCPVDDSRAMIACDPPIPCPSGCVCKLNYKRISEKDDRCIVSSTCPPVKCTRPNEVWDPCPSECRRESCADVNNQPTTCNTLVLNCQPQCICKKGYFRNDSDICIPAKDCPNNNQPCDDPNAERLECAPAPSCRSTCAKPNPGPCIRSCAVNECVCKKGYVLSAKGGKCIPVDQCPQDAPCNGDSNAVIKTNLIPCPSTCSAPNANPWCKRAVPPVGCECKPGYLLAEDGGKCVKPDECPGGNPCGVNGTFVWCSVRCPNDECPVDDSRGIIACDPSYPCPNGCICNLNYKRRSSSDDTCILSSTCPPVKCTRPNEVWDPCPSQCRSESCRNANQIIFCKPSFLNCQPRCVCKKGHYRNDEDICVPENECPNNKPCDDPNAERLECAPHPSCRSTCAVPDPSPCIQSCAINQCVCKKGYVLSNKDGKCIAADQCPKDAPCNGDSNAVIKVGPIPCPSTCSSPNANPFCKRYAPPIGCECKPGYILEENAGKCIKPDECPGGNPCGVNGTFAACSVNCPTENCPVTDSRAIIACSIAYPCPSGCVCKLNYKRKSYTDYTCILASDCPPVKCTRPNEVWSRCPPDCRREYCGDIEPTVCNTLVETQCQPQCICKKGYFRNDTDICIPDKQCPNKQQCSDPNAERVKCAPATQCRPTCAERNPGPCIEICITDDCVCKKGYILSEKNGSCIPENQCPVTAPCSDPNAERVTCGLNPECRATCARPNPGLCISQICMDNACVCKAGYVLSEQGGKCVAPEECPSGNHCGRNETFLPCIVQCPNDYCPTSNKPNEGICKTPNPCRPGCVCKINYRRRSLDDQRCMYASECPPQKCNKNEVWSGCPSDCLQEDCSDMNKPPVICNTLLLNCQPKCICKKGHYRDSNRNCVPAKQCPKPVQCKANEVYKTCRAICPPQTCESIYTDYDCRNATQCEPGCDCRPEYLRNGTANDPCIPSNLCPTNGPSTPNCGINEHYETDRVKCDLTCKNYDLEAQIGPCEPRTGCFCDDGYVRNSNGLCIAKKRCPKPVQCKANEVYKTCRAICPPQTCESIYTDYDCRNATQCEPGCDCRPEYLRNGTANDPCIPSNLCPTNGPSTPNCGINEHYETDRFKCDLTCKNYDLEAQIGPCEPRTGCFCDDGYVRNSNGLCIAKNRCPKNIVCKKNEVLSECYNSCHTTCKTRIRSDGRMCSLACVATGCLCIEGYLRHDNGTCVPINECSPPQCNANETYSSCGSACPATCQNRGDTCTACTAQCVEDCFCSKGYVRAEDGTCVKPKDCPPRSCGGPNEHFEACPPTCPPTDGCSNIWSKFNCTNAVKCCKPQCRCDSGYLRKNGICVSGDQCLTKVTPS